MSSLDDVLQHSSDSDVTITTISRSQTSTGDGTVMSRDSEDVESPPCVVRSAPWCRDDLLELEHQQTAMEHPVTAADAGADGDDSIAYYAQPSRFNNLIFTALHGMQTRSSDENSVCPSVRPSVRLSHACIVTKR